jgi:hypothetical protein
MAFRDGEERQENAQDNRDRKKSYAEKIKSLQEEERYKEKLNKLRRQHKSVLGQLKAERAVHAEAERCREVERAAVMERLQHVLGAFEQVRDGIKDLDPMPNVIEALRDAETAQARIQAESKVAWAEANKEKASLAKEVRAAKSTAEQRQREFACEVQRAVDGVLERGLARQAVAVAAAVATTTAEEMNVAAREQRAAVAEARRLHAIHARTERHLAVDELRNEAHSHEEAAARAASFCEMLALKDAKAAVVHELRVTHGQELNAARVRSAQALAAATIDARAAAREEAITAARTVAVAAVDAMERDLTEVSTAAARDEAKREMALAAAAAARARDDALRELHRTCAARTAALRDAIAAAEATAQSEVQRAAALEPRIASQRALLEEVCEVVEEYRAAEAREPWWVRLEMRHSRLWLPRSSARGVRRGASATGRASGVRVK